MSSCGDGVGMGRKPAGMGRGWGQTMRGWGGDGEDLLVAGRGWGRDCLPASLSSVCMLLVHSSFYCTTGGCTWTTSVETFSRNIGLIIPASNVSACQTACIQIVGCKGIDWIISQANSCFLQSTQAGRKHDNSTHYDLQC